MQKRKFKINEYVMVKNNTLYGDGILHTAGEKARITGYDSWSKQYFLKTVKFGTVTFCKQAQYLTHWESYDVELV